MRIFPAALAVVLIALGAFLLFLVYYAVSSVWGYGGEGAQREYFLVAAGELIVGAWLVVSGFRILRFMVRTKRAL